MHSETMLAPTCQSKWRITFAATMAFSRSRHAHPSRLSSKLKPMGRFGSPLHPALLRIQRPTRRFTKKLEVKRGHVHRRLCRRMILHGQGRRDSCPTSPPISTRRTQILRTCHRPTWTCWHSPTRGRRCVDEDGRKGLDSGRCTNAKTGAWRWSGGGWGRRAAGRGGL